MIYKIYGYLMLPLFLLLASLALLLAKQAQAVTATPVQ
jgi:hypothetical protein